ncbi:MAG: N-acetylmuramic acid 6-phosphate etherase, partial [Sphingomonadales bacterium]
MATEAIDPNFVDIDMWPTAEAVKAILAAQVEAVTVLESQAAVLAATANAAAKRLRSGGRIAYA